MPELLAKHVTLQQSGKENVKLQVVAPKKNIIKNSKKASGKENVKLRVVAPKKNIIKNSKKAPLKTVQLHVTLQSKKKYKVIISHTSQNL
jgi:hypothetical protein